MNEFPIPLKLVEIRNGILGVNRDIMFQLIELIHFKSDELVKNLIGISEESVLWLNHPHYPFYKNPKLVLKKKILPNRRLEKDGFLKITDSSILFKLKETGKCGSVFFDVLVKKIIIKCTIKIEFDDYQEICIGISTFSQLNNAMSMCIGDFDCGASFYLYSFSSYIMCSGNLSRLLKEGRGMSGENLTVIINQKNNNTKNVGKMNFFRNGKSIPHTITNIPCSGVYFGFSSHSSSFIFNIISLDKLRVPPADAFNNDGVMRFVAYDFNGEFEHNSFNHRDEDGKEISNIKEYYQ